MKTIEKFRTGLVTILVVLFCMSTASLYSQTQTKQKASQECCSMKDGKMMYMKDGKMVAMTKEVTMQNGTKCMPNGQCIMKDGKKMKLKEGECVNMKGVVCTAKTHCKSHPECCNMKGKGSYCCPMHKDATCDKPCKCPKCGMEMQKKK